MHCLKNTFRHSEISQAGSFGLESFGDPHLGGMGAFENSLAAILKMRKTQLTNFVFVYLLIGCFNSNVWRHINVFILICIYCVFWPRSR